MQEGDPRYEHFEEIYEACFGPVSRYALRRLEPQAAEELVAETFAIAWRRLDVVPADAPLPWLYAVARNLLSEHHRSSRRRTRSIDSAADVGVISDHGDLASDVGERDVVRRALEALSERDREAILLVAWEGLGHADAARVLGLTRAAFSMRFSRARRRLRAALDTHETPEAAAASTPTTAGSR